MLVQLSEFVSLSYSLDMCWCATRSCALLLLRNLTWLSSLFSVRSTSDTFSYYSVVILHTIYVIKYHRVSVHMPTCICLSSVDISSAVSVWICFVAFVSLVRFSCSFSVLLWKTGAQNWCHTPRDSRKRRLIGKGAVALSSVVPASAVLGLICLNTTSPFRWHKRPLFVCPLQHERPTEWNNLTKGIIILLSSQLTIMFIPTWERMR